MKTPVFVAVQQIRIMPVIYNPNICNHLINMDFHVSANMLKLRNFLACWTYCAIAAWEGCVE
jgi:hypothetical protein